jgi:hypothetical protein
MMPAGPRKTEHPVVCGERHLDYFFLPAACLSLTACCFFWLDAVALDSFWLLFFWLDFGERSPILFSFVFELICIPACLFPRETASFSHRRRDVNHLRNKR